MSKEKERRGSVSPSLNTNCLQSTLRTKTLLRGAQPRAPSSRQLQGRAQSSMRQWGQGSQSLNTKVVHLKSGLFSRRLDSAS